MRKQILNFAAAIVMLLPIMARSQGTLVVSNLGQNSTGSGAVGSDAWIAQPIGIGAESAAYTLNSIQFLAGNPTGNPGTFSLSLYSSLNGLPSQDLGNLTGPNPSVASLFTYTASGITISPGEYFVVATASTPISQGAYDWIAANGGAQGITTGPNGMIDDKYYSSTDGSNWSVNYRQDVFQLGIYASAVPEPTSCSLAALGALVLGFGFQRNISR